jgi:hypothetical protein
MAKVGKEIENRLSVSKKVVEAALTHGPEIAKLLAELAAAAHDDSNGKSKSKAPTVEAYIAQFIAFASILTLAAEVMHEAALAYAAEQADDVAPRAARDTNRDALLALMVTVRTGVEGALGWEGIKTYGMEGSTPRTPEALANHVTTVIMLMTKKPALVTTEIGTTFSTKACIAALEPKKAALDTSIKDVGREKRELEDAAGKRDKAIEQWGEVYQGVANTLTGLFRLGGRNDLADRVRPTTRALAGEDAGAPEETEAPAEGQTPPAP